MAQLLFMSSRAFQDIHIPVIFLNTCANKPDKDDWGKLKRILRYFKGTHMLKLALIVGNISVVNCVSTLRTQYMRDEEVPQGPWCT